MKTILAFVLFLATAAAQTVGAPIGSQTSAGMLQFGGPAVGVLNTQAYRSAGSTAAWAIFTLRRADVPVVLPFAQGLLYVDQGSTLLAVSMYEMTPAGVAWGYATPWPVGYPGWTLYSQCMVAGADGGFYLTSGWGTIL